MATRRRHHGLALGLGLLAASLMATAALPQSPPPPPITATPLAPPPGVTGQPLTAPPGTPAATPPGTSPAASADTQTNATQPGSPQPGTTTAPPSDSAAPQGFAPAPPVPRVWQPEAVAELQVLDKVDAQAVTLNVKVGSSAQVRALTIGVRACDATAKDQPQDATAFLDITDGHPDAPSFHGWMLKSDPSVSMLQHPIYDVRVLSCHA